MGEKEGSVNCVKEAHQIFLKGQARKRVEGPETGPGVLPYLHREEEE